VFDKDSLICFITELAKVEYMVNLKTDIQPLIREINGLKVNKYLQTLLRTPLETLKTTYEFIGGKRKTKKKRKNKKIKKTRKTNK